MGCCCLAGPCSAFDERANAGDGALSFSKNHDGSRERSIYRFKGKQNSNAVVFLPSFRRYGPVLAGFEGSHEQPLSGVNLCVSHSIVSNQTHLHPRGLMQDETMAIQAGWPWLARQLAILFTSSLVRPAMHNNFSISAEFLAPSTSSATQGGLFTADVRPGACKQLLASCCVL